MWKIFIFIFFFNFHFLCAQIINEGIFASNRLKFILGQDGVTPIEITFKSGEKKMLWTFGDTLLGNWKGNIATTATLNFQEISDIKSMPPNTLAMTEIISTSNYKNLIFNFYPDNKNITEFIKYEKLENPFIKRMWANDGIQIKNKVYIFYMDIEIKKEQAGNFNFKGTGMVVANIPSAPEISSFNFERVKGFYIQNILLGDSVVKKGKYLYISGRKSPPDNKSLSTIIFARVKEKNITNFSNYEFLSRDGKWQRKEIGAFFDGVTGETSLVYDKYQKYFRVIYMNIKGEICKITFKHFKDIPQKYRSEIIYKPEVKKDIMYYSAKEVFYNGNCLYLIYMDPSIYQPILLKAMP